MISVLRRRPRQPPASALELERAWVLEYLAGSGRGFRPGPAGNGTGVLGRVLVASGRYAWDVERPDLAAALATLAAQGQPPQAQRAALRVFTGFHRFLAATKAEAIAAAFGVELADPLLERSLASAATEPLHGHPPRPERVDAFFGFLRERLSSVRQFSAAARDYTILRALYHAGLSAQEACRLAVADVHLRQGPSGTIAVRSRRLTGSLAPARQVPMLDGLDVIVRWYLEDARPPISRSPWLFCDEHGGHIRRGRARNRLAFLLEVEGRGAADHFSPHGLRHAGAVRNYERGLDLETLRNMLGHPDRATTLRYVLPSASFVAPPTENEPPVPSVMGARAT